MSDFETLTRCLSQLGVDYKITGFDSPLRPKHTRLVFGSGALFANGANADFIFSPDGKLVEHGVWGKGPVLQ